MLLQIPDVLTAEQVAHARAPARRGRLGGRPRHRRPPVGAGQGQPAAARGPSGRRASSASMILARAAAQPAVHVGGAAAARLPAAVQPLRRRAVVRQPRRQRHPPGRRHGAPHPHRSVGDAVPRRAGRVRRRRAAGRGHLRRARGQAAGRPHGALPVDQPAPRAAGDARRAHRVVLLDPEHGARRRRADAAVRSRHGDPAAHRGPAANTRPPCSSRRCITTCCAAGRERVPAGGFARFITAIRGSVRAAQTARRSWPRELSSA